MKSFGIAVLLVEAVEIGYKRNVMAAMKWTHDWVRNADVPNREFLFLIETRAGNQGSGSY